MPCITKKARITDSKWQRLGQNWAPRWSTSPTEIWPISIPTSGHRRHRELLEITIIMEGIDKFTTHGAGLVGIGRCWSSAASGAATRSTRQRKRYQRNMLRGRNTRWTGREDQTKCVKWGASEDKAIVKRGTKFEQAGISIRLSVVKTDLSLAINNDKKKRDPNKTINMISCKTTSAMRWNKLNHGVWDLFLDVAAVVFFENERCHKDLCCTNSQRPLR